MPVKDTVLCLCELGWLYSKVSSHIQACDRAQVSRGLAVQAFSFALQEELHDYYRLLAVLEQELARKIITENTPAPAVSPEDTPSDSSIWVTSVNPKGTSGLTLLRLRAWMQEPMDRMFMMARLVDSASPLTGGVFRILCYCLYFTLIQFFIFLLCLSIHYFLCLLVFLLVHKSVCHLRS